MVDRIDVDDAPGGIAKGSPLDDGGFRVRGTIVKAKGLGDATRKGMSRYKTGGLS